MALVKCKKCGKEISDKVKECPNCGGVIDEREASENVEEKISEIIKKDDDISKNKILKRKKELYIGIIIIVVLTTIISSYFIVKSINKKKMYEQAVELMNEGKTKDAYDKFVKLNKYKDSEKYASELKEQVIYEEAIQCLDNGDFSEAVELLKTIPDYEKAQVLLTMVSSKYEGVSDDTYFAGMSIIELINNEDFEKRIGEKLKESIEENFGYSYDEVATGEIINVLNNADYVVSMVEVINSIPETSDLDKKFKNIILSIYKMKMDGIYSNYIEEENINSSKVYRVKLKLIYGVEDEELCDLFDLVNATYDSLAAGEDDISDLNSLLSAISEMTIFGDIGK